MVGLHEGYVWNIPWAAHFGALRLLVMYLLLTYRAVAVDERKIHGRALSCKAQHHVKLEDGARMCILF